MDRRKMIKEAVERMEMLDLLDLPEESIIREFKENQVVYVSRPKYLGVMTGVLYKLSDAERKLVQKIEEDHDILIYHAIRNETNIGVMYAFLYVSGNEKEWKMDRKMLENIDTDAAHPLAYVWNAGDIEVDADDLSDGFGEWGAVSVVKGEGGLCRILSISEEENYGVSL